MPEGKSVGRQEPAFRGPVQRQTYARARRHLVRLRVLDVLADTGRQTSARELTEALRRRAQPTEYYTVKAALEALCASGLVCRTRIGHTNWYELPPTVEVRVPESEVAESVESPLLGLIQEVAKGLTRSQLKMLIDKLCFSLSHDYDDDENIESNAAH